MARAVQMDQFHLTAYAPPDLAPAEYDAIRRTLDDARFRAALRAPSGGSSVTFPHWPGSASPCRGSGPSPAAAARKRFTRRPTPRSRAP